MAIFRKTEPGLLYELSPGRDGRLLVWSPGLMKYKDCTSLADMSNVNSNYLEQDIDDGCWFYQLPSLVNGDNMFYNDTIDTLYEGRSPLWHFEANLQSLQSGVNMFKGCSLDAVSVKRIADTLPNTSTGTITLGIHCSLSADSSVVASLAKIESKGWAVEAEYNLPYGFTELEYIENSGTQWILIPEQFTAGSGVHIAADLSQVTLNYDYVWYLTASNGFSIWMGNSYAPAVMSSGLSTYNSDPNVSLKIANKGYDVTYWTNWLNDNRIVLTVGGETQQQAIPQPLSLWNKAQQGLFAQIKKDDTVVSSISNARILWARFSQGSKITCNLVPVLDANGTPCMYDKVNNTCFYNDGSGTFGYKIKRTGDEVAPFSLRDPYYVAPSGVYARPSGENELDIVADTDMTADIAEQDGYIWFANTGEAYDHFGITPQPEG